MVSRDTTSCCSGSIACTKTASWPREASCNPPLWTVLKHPGAAQTQKRRIASYFKKTICLTPLCLTPPLHNHPRLKTARKRPIANHNKKTHLFNPSLLNPSAFDFLPTRASQIKMSLTKNSKPLKLKLQSNPRTT